MEHILDLTGKKYIVTGASSGIGRETCKYLGKLGATVILVARNELRLKECVKELAGGGHRYYSFDLSDVEKIEVLIKTIVDENGKLDGVVHSAGVGWCRPVKNTTYSFMRDMFNVNLFAFMEILRLFSMKKYNTGAGSVVAVSSHVGVMGQKAVTAYSSSKGGVDSIVRVAALELAEKNIRVNSVQPGWVRTDMMNEFLQEVAANGEKAVKDTARAVEAVEVASVIAFLLSDAASGVNGVSVPIMGRDIRFK